jgi:predicted MFS family arabinose efflux permease
MMVAGGLGALAATAPLEYALRFATWREIFVALAVATLAVAVWIAWRVPDTPPPQQAQGFATQWSGVRSVFGSARFWWIAPLVGFSTGSFMAVQGLWAVPWMMEVEQVSRVEAARVLLAMGIAILAGYMVIATLATRLGARGVKPRHLFVAGFASNGLAFAAILAQLPGSILWWSIYGLGAAANVLAFAVLNEGFPKELAARANTAVNLVTFLGSFATQWGIGVVVDLARAGLGYDGPSGLRLAFALVLVLDAATFAWFLAGWRRNAVHASAAATG